MKASHLLLTAAMSLSLNLSFSQNSQNEKLQLLTGKDYKSSPTYSAFDTGKERRDFKQGRRRYNRFDKTFHKMEEGTGKIHGNPYYLKDSQGVSTLQTAPAGIMNRMQTLEAKSVKDKEYRKDKRALRRELRQARRSARSGNRRLSKDIRKQSNEMMRDLKQGGDLNSYEKYSEDERAEFTTAYKKARKNRSDKGFFGRLFHGKRKVRNDFLNEMGIDSKKQRRRWALGKLEDSTDNEDGFQRYKNAIDFVQKTDQKYLKFINDNKLDMIAKRNTGSGASFQSATSLITDQTGDVPVKKTTGGLGEVKGIEQVTTGKSGAHISNVQFPTMKLDLNKNLGKALAKNQKQFKKRVYFGIGKGKNRVPPGREGYGDKLKPIEIPAASAGVHNT